MTVFPFQVYSTFPGDWEGKGGQSLCVRSLRAIGVLEEKGSEASVAWRNNDRVAHTAVIISCHAPSSKGHLQRHLLHPRNSLVDGKGRRRQPRKPISASS